MNMLESLVVEGEEKSRAGCEIRSEKVATEEKQIDRHLRSEEQTEEELKESSQLSLVRFRL